MPTTTDMHGDNFLATLSDEALAVRIDLYRADGRRYRAEATSASNRARRCMWHSMDLQEEQLRRARAKQETTAPGAPDATQA